MRIRKRRAGSLAYLFIKLKKKIVNESTLADQDHSGEANSRIPLKRICKSLAWKHTSLSFFENISDQEA